MNKYIIWINRFQEAQLIKDFDKAMKDFPITIVHTAKPHGFSTVEVRVEVTGSESELETFETWMKQFSAYRI